MTGFAGWHEDVGGGWYIQPSGGIWASVKQSDDGRFTFMLCGIPMPSDYVYGSAIEAKAAALGALRAKLKLALEKIA